MEEEADEIDGGIKSCVTCMGTVSAISAAAVLVSTAHNMLWGDFVCQKGSWVWFVPQVGLQPQPCACSACDTDCAAFSISF